LQNVLMKGAETGTWLNVDIRASRALNPLIGVQRIGSSAAPLQGEHEQFPQPLAQRMFVDQARQIGGRVVAPASAGGRTRE
jgi:hypothetical protein